ncbi:hypothetical protein HJC23_008950 [Cyclotella cryptica]|uniref:Complex 1 LYR protein n=1 Tax=Cyclotella cryptica TaxID=29204 RepID=A0ABD3Q294_9STRA|eukprot:CCRYP_009633-RA/>CCRYP_009633-RA protein AED:0.47 eAED:0.54 QI:0/-1/0/1/-1/1/1/0/140
MSGPTQRTSIELYRDLLRLVSHIAPGTTSPKSRALRTMIRTEFDKSRTLSPDSHADAIKIEGLKANAVRALSNYMLYEGGIQDRGKGGKLGMAMDNFHERSLKGMDRGQTKRTGAEERRGHDGHDVLHDGRGAESTSTPK